MNWSLTNDFRQIEEYKENKLALSTDGFRALGTKLSFKQLRFLCHKKIPGPTFDIATMTNSSGRQVIQYFANENQTIFPESCGSYYRLSDDNSKIASRCKEWGYESSKFGVGKWHHDDMPTNNRLLKVPAFLRYEAHWLVEQ